MVATKRSWSSASSDRQIAAIHGYGAAGYPARLVGGEKQHRPDEIVGLAEPAERNQRVRRALAELVLR